MTPDDLTALVKPHLKRKEKLVWVGRPATRSFVSGVSLILPVFGRGFLGIIGFRLYQAAQTGGPSLVIAAVFTSPFLLLGLAIFRIPHLEYQQGQRVVYAVTNQRAMLLRLSEPPVVKSYRAADFTPFEIEPTAILFAGDSALDGFMPGYRGQPAALVGPVVFVGLTADEVSKVRRHLEALKEAPPVDEAVDVAESRRSADPERIYEVAARYRIAKENLESWGQEQGKKESARQMEAHGGCLKAVVVLAALALVATIAAAIYLREPNVIVGAAFMLGPVFVGLFILALIVQVVSSHVYGGQVQQRPYAIPTLDRLEADRHPDTFLYGWMDLGDVRGVRPVRMANSPHSGALKTYHKHHWARFVLGLADGNELALSLVDKVKLKSSAEVSRRHFMRGRLRVNPAHFDVSRLTEGFSAGKLTAVPHRVGQSVVIYFGGEIARPDEVTDQLAALYRQLPVKA